MKGDLSMTGILHFLNWLNENWTIIVLIVTLIVTLYLKAKTAFNRWLKMTDEEKQKDLEEQIIKAKQAVANYILSFVANAEVDWDGPGLGPIKRAQVIEKIYKDYPILLEVKDQFEFMKFIDEHIDLALETVREKLRKDEVQADDV
jgi:hypothetical protein